MSAVRGEPGSFFYGLLRFLCAVLGIVLALMIAVTVYVEHILGNINRFDETDQMLSHEQIEALLNQDPQVGDLDGPEGYADALEKEDHIINFLLIGQDRRGNAQRERSDAMILCTVNTREKTLVMTSFLRDMYVKFPSYQGKNYGNNRINATYAIGGMEMLDDCLAMNFGVDVDYNIEVDFSGFEEIVDLMGGLDIELTKAEADWIGNGLKEGINRLDGKNALEYARIRKLDSDFGRTNRQRTVLSAMLNQAKTLSVKEILELTNGVLPLITTDMSNREMIRYIFRLFPILSGLEVSTQYIPADGCYESRRIDGMSVLVPDLEANIQILKDTIG